MYNFKKYIEKKDNINEIIFCWCILLVIIGLPIRVLFGDKIHLLFFVINLIIMLIVSFFKNKKILLKNDIILLAFVSVFFFIDFFIRKNDYTLSTYYNFIRKCYIPCYFFNRTKNLTEILRIFSKSSRIVIIVFVFDAIFNYYFSNNYMTYGFTIMLFSFFSIYVYRLIEKHDTDILFLIISLLEIFVYSNRTCILSVICLLIFTLKIFIENFKNKSEQSKDKIQLHKNGIVLLLICISFVINYSLIYIEKNNITFSSIVKSVKSENINLNEKEEQNEKNSNLGEINENIDNKLKNDKDNEKIITFRSYSLTKYKEAVEGKKKTILSGRAEIYTEAANEIKNDICSNPFWLLFGRGTGYFRNLNNGTYTHNIVLDFIIEYGLIGTIFFVCLILYCIIKLFLNYKNREEYLFGIYWLFLAFPRLLLSLYFQDETTFWVFIVFALTYYPIRFKGKLKINQEE